MSIFQRHHILFTLAKGGDSLKSAFRLREHSHRTVAINGMTVFSEVPTPALPGGLLRDGSVHGRLRRQKAVRTVKRN